MNREPVPRVNSDEISDRISQHPLTENEMVKYLIRKETNINKNEQNSKEFTKVI